MRVGDVCLTKKFARYSVSPIVQATVNYAAPKGEVFVFLLLGTTSAKEPKFSADEALEAMGWKFIGDEPTASDPQSAVSPLPR